MDYEAAATLRFETVRIRALEDGYQWAEQAWGDCDPEERQEWIDEVRPYVDAALGGGR